MNTVMQRFILLLSFMILIIFLCTPPHNPFDDTDNVRLLIKVTEKPDGYNHCINDKVRFKVTVLFADLVKKISIHFDENGDKDEKEITTDDSNEEEIFFEYIYKEKGLKNVKFSITFRQPLAGRDTVFNIDIGVKPTIRNKKNLVVVGDIIPDKSLILTADHEEFSSAAYQWFKDSKLLPGQDERSLIFNPLKESDEGQYYCIVTTDWGKDQSKPFTVSFKKIILEPPKTQIDPQSIQVTEGNIARFTIRATGEMIEYQWQKNEEDIPGANDSFYEVNDLKTGDSATFRCIVFNSSGKDTSKSATLEVVENRITPKIMKHPESQEVEEGDTVRFFIESYGTDLKYKWFRDDEEIENAVHAVLETGPVSIADNGKIFHCLVYNDEGEEVSKKATLTVKGISRPKITVHPSDTSVTVGTPAMFTVDVEGKRLTYQWFENGIKIKQAIGQSYIVKEAALTDNGKKYSCAVSNSSGEVKSNEAILTVLDKIVKPEIVEQPNNQEVTVGKDARFLVVARGGELTYQWQMNRENITGATGYEYIHKNSKIEYNGKKFRCIISNKAGQVISREAILEVNNEVIAPKITSQPQNLTVKESDEANFSITAVGTDLSFQWSKNGKEISGEDKSLLTISSAKRKDNGAKYTCTVKNGRGKEKSSEAVLTVYYKPEISKQPQDIGVKVGKKAVFSVEVIKGNPEKTNFQWYKGNSKLSGETDKELTLAAGKDNDGDKFSCKISNDAGYEVKSKPAELSVYYIEIIKDLSNSLTITEGSQVKLEISADAGSGGIAYQWYEDGAEIDGQNKSSYSFKVKTSHNGKEYKCRAVNKADKSVYIDSKTLTLNVDKNQEKPNITKDLSSSKTVEDGEQVRLKIEAECNTSDIEYQWYEDGSKLSGETKRSYSFTAKTSLDGNKYKCRVYNATETTLYVDSKELKLTVKKQPKPTIKITSPGAESVVHYNKKITIKANVTGADITVKYYLDSESQLLGEGSSDGSYSWTPKQTGVYTVIGKVTNKSGEDASHKVKVAVVNQGTMVFLNAKNKTFPMGTDNCDGWAGMENWRPQRQIKLVRNFYINKYETTQSEYKKIMGSNPSEFNGSSLPVENVTWHMAVEFCNKKSEEEGFEKVYSNIGSNNVTIDYEKIGYRLPTEAEWVFAAKGGAKTDFYWGKNCNFYKYPITSADTAEISNYAWWAFNSSEKTHPVGKLKPNKFGLFDIAGNVIEWCNDWFATGYYSSKPKEDPKGPSSGSGRIHIGGCFENTNNVALTSVGAGGYNPSKTWRTLGFRYILSLW